MIEIDREVDPIAGRRHFKFAVMADIDPVIAEKKLDNVAVPKFQAVLAVIRWQPKIQLRVGTNEEQIEVRIRPESANLSLELAVVELFRAVFFDPC